MCVDTGVCGLRSFGVDSGSIFHFLHYCRTSGVARNLIWGGVGYTF